LGLCRSFTDHRSFTLFTGDDYTLKRNWTCSSPKDIPAHEPSAIASFFDAFDVIRSLIGLLQSFIIEELYALFNTLHLRHPHFIKSHPI
jgi:hypothetical protein